MVKSRQKFDRRFATTSLTNSDNPRLGKPTTLVVEDVVIKRGKTTTVEAILGGTASVTGLNAPMSMDEEPELEESKPIEETEEYSPPLEELENEEVPPVNDSDANPEVEGEEDSPPLEEPENEEVPPVEDFPDPEVETENN
ncbi:MAG: hypothetical protein GX046_08060 [Tissierellia bacterium]|nr:hypothetical protein [Tissierellia bacterium]